jgi:hypothetical protein
MTTRFAIVSSTGCAGFILTRGPKGFEAFSADEKSIGTYSTEDAAVEAITQKITTPHVETSI